MNINVALGKQSEGIGSETAISLTIIIKPIAAEGLTFKSIA